MKQQYESEVLYKLMERDGLNIPSSVPPYESEIKQYFIEQIKLAYPKLTDYEAEWLLYNYIEYLPADFPIETALNVTQCRFENVVPYAYKSAILKGQTLVNIANYSDATVNKSSKYIQIGSLVYSVIGKPITLFNFTDKVITFQLIANGSFKQSASINANSKTVITLSDGEEIKNIRGTQANGWIIDETSLNELKLGIMVIEGDYINTDIPYFEGMQSVQMPVLTTSNEDGTKTNILSAPSDLVLRGIGDVQDTLDCLTGELTERIEEIVIDGTIESRINIHQPNNSELLTFRLGNVANDGIIDIQPMSDKLLWDNTSGLLNYPYSFRLALYGNPAITCLFICLPKSVLSEESANGLIEWLANNPVKIQYPINKSVKTVDLTVVNQDGEECYFMPIEGTMHMVTNAQTIKPLLDVEVPVEAITQNLASFINMKMNDEVE